MVSEYSEEIEKEIIEISVSTGLSITEALTDHQNKLNELKVKPDRVMEELIHIFSVLLAEIYKPYQSAGMTLDHVFSDLKVWIFKILEDRKNEL